VLALMALGSTGACDMSDPCDPGYHEELGVCHPPPPPDAGRKSADAGSSADDAAAGDASAPRDPHEGFGDPCMDRNECPDGFVCGAPMLPMCTRTNCMDDATICPPGWTCFDTTGVSPDPSVNSICLDL
jgi:hypothetical protein